MSAMKVRKANTILLPLESYLYLQDKEYFERCGRHKSDKMIAKLTQNFNQFQHNGYKRLMDGDLGGCVGKPENSYEEGRWTSWSCEDMKRILDEAGLPYKDGEETEYIAVSL